jgi:phosphotransferase system enzyme I (PtsI)
MAVRSLQGIGVSRGFAIGKAILLRHDTPEVHEYSLPLSSIEQEVSRFQRSLTSVKQQLRTIRGRIVATVPGEAAAFIDTHLLMLEDSNLAEAPVEIIRRQCCNAEWALKLQRDRIVRIFDEMEDPYLRARKDDVDQVIARIQRTLVTDEPEAERQQIETSSRLEDRIIVADDLTPADTMLMQHQGVLAFVTEHGGPLSHTAILARSLEIPAVVGVRDAQRQIQDDDLIIVDGRLGLILIKPDQDVLNRYQHKGREEQQRREALGQLKGQPAITRDAVTIDLYVNIELPEDTAAAQRVAADGVGLYRTEFLFMNRSDVPDEDEHLASYLNVIRALDNRPLTIRTLDLGADKQVDSGRLGDPVPTNPALGLRAIRLCLKELDLFRPQLRAILRASACGPVRMMIPMLSNTRELFEVLQLIEDCKQELRAAGQAFDNHMPVGAMIEVPAAAICASYFARHLDFLSIGTNDLIQYTLAIDRIDDEVSYLYDPLHPAVLQLIHMTLQAGRQAGIPVSLCGEMASDTRYTQLLLGLGLTQFSTHPGSLLEIKRVIRESHVSELQIIAKRILQTSDPAILTRLLEQITRCE